MRFTLPLLLSLALYGCVTTTGKHQVAPSLAVAQTDVSQIQGHVAKSTTQIKSAQQMIAELDKAYPPAVPTFSLMNSDLTSALAENAQAQANIEALKLNLTSKQVEIDSVTLQSNKLSDKVATDTLAMAKKDTRILQLWIALGGIIVLVGGFFVLRQYFPFLKVI